MMQLRKRSPSGRREENKADKLRRIKTAARDVFVAKGYDEATTREIAKRAKVALGTLFIYAANKRDLLFLTINDEYADIARRAADHVESDAPILANLLSMFRQLYIFFSESPQLSRLVLREMQFYDEGLQARRFANTVNEMISLSTRVAREAQRSGEIKAGTPAPDIGRVIFSVYQTEVRRWLSKEPLRVAAGLRELEKSLKIVVEGLVAGASREEDLVEAKRTAARLRSDLP